MPLNRVKFLEIRDRATFIPAMAVELVGLSRPECYLLGRVGFSGGSRYIMLQRLVGNTATTDVWDWGQSRTMHCAHEYIIKEWESIHSGDVIDVEFIMGESEECKISEALEETY